MADKKKAPQYTSPAGTFRYPRLSEPDSTYNLNGEYSVQLLLDSASAEPLIALLKPIYDEAMQEGQEKDKQRKKTAREKTPFNERLFYTPLYDDKTEEETGEYAFKFSMTATGVDKTTNRKWNRRPALYDAKGNKLPTSINPWSGTLGKVSFKARPYFIDGTATAGLKLCLDAVQILELRDANNSERSAESFGFGCEEGYEAVDLSTTEETPNSPATEEDSDASEETPLPSDF